MHQCNKTCYFAFALFPIALFHALKKIKLTKILLLIFILFASTFQAADYVWDGGGGNSDWSTGTNWAPDAGAGGPGSGDNALIDTGATNVTITGAASVLSLVITNGATLKLDTTLNASSGIAIGNTSVLICGAATVSTGNLTNTGSLTSSSAVINCSNFISSNTFTASGATVISSSGNVDISGTFTHNSSTTLYMSGTKSLSSTVPLYNLTIVSGVIAFNNSITLVGALTVDSGAVLEVGTNNLFTAGNISSNGGTLTNVSGNLSCADFSSTGAFSSSGTTAISTTGDVAISGTFTHSNFASFYMSGTKNLSSTVPLYNLNVISGAVTLTTSLSLSGNLSVTVAQTLNLAANDLSIAGNINNSGVLNTSTGKIRCVDFTSSGAFAATGTTTISTFGDVMISGTFMHNSSTTLAMTGTKLLSVVPALYDLQIVSGAITLLGDISLANNLTVNSGATYNLNIYKLLVSGNITNSGILNTSTGDISCGDFISSGTFIAAGTAVISTSGDVAVTGVFTHNSTTTLALTGTKTLTTSVPLGNVSINSGAISLLSNVNIANNFGLYNAAVFHATAKTITIQGNVSIPSGAFDFRGSALNILGSWDSGTSPLTASQSVLSFTGSTNQTVNMSGNILEEIIVNNIGTPGKVVFSSAAGIRVSGNLTVSDGVMDLSVNDPFIYFSGVFNVGAQGNILKGASGAGGKIIYEGASTKEIISNSQDLGDVTVSSGTVSITKNLKTDNLTVSSGAVLQINAGSNSVIFTINNGKTLLNSGTIQVLSDVNELRFESDGLANIDGAGGFISGSGKIFYLKNISMVPALTLNTNDTVILGGSCTFNGLMLNNQAVFTQGTNFTLTLKGDFLVDSGATFNKDAGTGKIYFNNVGNQTVRIGNKDLGNIEIGSSSTVKFEEQATVNNVSILSGGLFQLNGTSLTTTLNVENGGVITNDGYFQVFNSTKPVTLQSPGSCTFSGTALNLLNQSIYLSNVVFTTGTTLSTNEKIYLAGNCTFTNLSTSAASAHIYQGANNNLTLNGNLTILTATFNPDTGSGQVIFNGGTTQVVNANSNNIGKIVVTGTTNLSISNNIQLNGITIDNGSSLVCGKADNAVTITAGGLITVNGLLQFTGPQLGDEIVLASSSLGNPYSLNKTVLGTVTFSRVKIGDCTATGNTVDASNNCINTGGNTNVTFLSVTWVGGGLNKNYSNSANWDLNFVPLFDDNVIFDGVNNCIIDVPSALGRLTMAATYTGTVTVNTATVTINSDMNFLGGTIVDNGNIIYCKGNWNKSGGTYTATGTVIMTASTGTVYITSGGAPFSNLTVTGNALFYPQDALTVNGNLTVSANATLRPQNTLTVNNNAAITTNGLLDFNGKGNALKGNFQNNGGSFTTGSTGLTFSAATGTKNISTGGNNCTINSLVFDDGGGNAVFVLQDSINVQNDLTINGGTVQAGSNNITIKGNFANSDIFSAGTGSVIFNKGGSQRITGGTSVYNNLIISGAGTVLDTITNLNLANLNIGGNASFSCVTSGVNITVVPSGVITVNASGTLDIRGAVSNISLSGVGGADFYLNNSGSVIFSKVSIKDCDASGGSALDATTSCANLGNNTNINFSSPKWNGTIDNNYFNPLNWNTGSVPLSTDYISFETGSANCSISSDVSVNNFSMTGVYSGIISLAAGKTFTVNGTASLTAGNFNCGSGILKVKGGFSASAGVFTAGTGTLEFAASGNLTTNGNVLNKLLISGSGTIVSLKDNLTNSGITVGSSTEFKCLENNISITTTAGESILIAGVFTLIADATREIKLRSGTTGSTFYLTVSGTASVTGVDFKDCDARGGTKINAANDCVDSGNNFNVSYFYGTVVLASAGAEVEYPADVLTKISIPALALEKDSKVSIDPVNLPSNRGIGFEMKASGFVDGKAISRLSAQATITIHYPAVFTGVTAGTYIEDQDVAIFYYNGVEWVKLGGVLNTAAKTIAIKTEQLGMYKAKASVRATAFALNQVVPKKIFTPNNDGVNDQIRFYIENPKDNEVVAKVYEYSGEEAADLQLDPTGTYYYWDGKNRSGNTAGVGIYLYQFKVDGNVISGTVVLAK
ncbi:MAG: hypothetical protein A2452_03890 [Candidatus Firestonebacteria bacterium RIFOXYC2_FULL_39_67]|nr:MAG: hypothetical protein A2536_08625 [Candidatus Firestonebacteria bacterium RIFOXYD2_FULL_39_29]OGF54705.1 MAG: hypothetical protein A2452_03890 [Candidatus Firestonebacteria bacterium RIFOXYC2_FULL_39_67]